MFKTKFWFSAAAAVIVLGGVAEDSAQAGWRWFRSPRSYQRSTYQSSAAAPNNRQSTRRYSLSPSAGGYGAQPYSYSPPANLGQNRYYNPGPGYSPRQGINRADFKIKGL